MNGILDYSEQAELALASYATLWAGMTLDAYRAALRDEDSVDMTATQASTFASKWEVIDQYTHSHTEVLPTYDDAGNLTGYTTLTTSNGLSVTVFKDKVTGERHVAIRGTEFTDIGDLTADGGILLHGIPDLSEQYQALKSKIEAWQSNGTLTGTFTVTGHSLGGWLAGGLAQDFAGSIEHTYLYNTPGVEGAFDGILQQLNEALGRSFASTPSLANLTNIRASTGISPIAGLGLPLSPPIGIHIEDQKLFDALFPGGADTPLSLNHSQRVLTDSLALYALFARIDPDASVESISKIIKAASAQNGDTLETTLDALRTLFQQNYHYGHLDYDAVPTLDSGTAASRNDYYAKLQSLTAWWEASPFTALTVKPLAELSGTQIAALAMADTADGQAYRYALYKLNPFAITDSSVLYDRINAHGELDLYDPANGRGNLTDQYIKDRAAMLSWKLHFAYEDIQPVGGTFVKPQGGMPFYFEDETTDTQIRIGGSLSVGGVLSRPLSAFRIVVFGSQNADAMTGQDKGDFLYGGASADTITGNGGNDYMEGGSGFDTYVINAGDGFDTILDTDGTGVIKLVGVLTKGSATAELAPEKWKQLGADIWVDTQNGITYSKSVVNGETQLLLHKGDSNVLVKGWSDSELGITLGAGSAPVSPITTRTYSGDQHAPLKSDGSYDWSATAWLTDGTLAGGVAEADFNDVIYGSAGADRMDGLGGNDALDGGAGTDRIDGGDGDDLIGGGAGSDLIYGGIGNDVILSATGLSAPGRSKPSDVWNPPAGTTVWTKGSTWGVYRHADGFTISGGGSLTQDDAPDVIYAGDGNDHATGGRGDDFIDGGIGNDTLWGNGGNDIIDGGAGDDLITGDGTTAAGFYSTTPASLHGDDILIGGGGKDKIWGGGGHDLLLGGTEADTLMGEAGHDVMDGGLGADYLAGAEGNDVYLNVTSEDTISDSKGANTVKLAANAIGGAGLMASVETNEAGQRYMQVQIDLDSGGALKVDSPFETDGTTTLEFMSGEVFDMETLIGEQLFTPLHLLVGDAGGRLFGGAGDDILKGGAGGDTLLGHSGDDTLYGNEGADTLAGGAGSDDLVGGDGDDVLDGGAGTDSLAGGKGNDTYINVTGEDTIWDTDGDNTIVLATANGVGSEGLSATVETNSTGNRYTQLKFSLDTGETLKLDSPFWSNSATIRFASGEEIDLESLVAEQLFTPLHLLIGGDGGRLFGGAGGDILEGGAGPDTMLGHEGGDTLWGRNGADVLDGGAGSDYLSGGAGDDQLFGGIGGDALYGGDGGDTLYGGSGNDTLDGGEGNDTYLFGLGSGQDVITSWASNGDIDTIRMGPSIAPEDVILARTGNDLSLSIIGASDNLIVNNWAYDERYQIERIDFANGVVWSGAYLQERFGAIPVIGTEGDDGLYGGEGDNVLDGLAGTDALDGGEGNDVFLLRPGSGEDTIVDIEGRNRVEFAEEIDLEGLAITQGENEYRLAYGGADDSIIVPVEWATIPNEIGFSDRSYVLSNELFNGIPVRFWGDEDDNVLVDLNTGVEFWGGWGGDDTMIGGAGDNVYDFDLGDWSDGIVDLGGVDTLRFGEGITPDDLYVEYGDLGNQLPNLRVYVGPDGDVVSIDNGELGVVEKFQFSDGLTLTFDEVLARQGGLYTLPAGLVEERYNERLYVGTAADDELDGGNGGDAYLGGLGDDSISGGRDTGSFYVFNHGDGNDTVRRVTGDFNYEGHDSLVFGAGITPESLSFSTVYREVTNYSPFFDPPFYTYTVTDTIIQYGAGDSVTMLADSLAALNFMFVDGSVATYSSLTTGISVGSGWIALGSFDLPPSDDARPTVYWRGTAGDDIYLARDMLSVNGQAAKPQRDQVDGGAGSDHLATRAGNDWLTGGQGNDLLEGGTGSDVYVFAEGDGADTIRETTTAGEKNYVLIEGEVAPTFEYDGSDLLVHYNNGADVIRVEQFFPSGLDEHAAVSGVLLDRSATGVYPLEIFYSLDDIKAAVHIQSGSPVDDTLVGSDANDFLFGNAGADTLEGAKGDDTLIGGSGDDTYVISLDDGVDTIIDSFAEGENNTIVFGAGVDPGLIKLFKGSLGLDLGGGNTVHIEGVDYDDLANTSSIRNFVFADGTLLSVEQMLARGFDVDGSAGDDVLSGTSVSDRINGGAGNDTLDGLAGNDVLDGNGGNDILAGGTGDDTYIVDSAADVIVEYAGEGLDTILSSVTYTLGADVENLTLTGAAAIDGTGNELGNVLTGNSANNMLAGGLGNDILMGGAGNDYLQGGAGDDAYVFGKGSGQDTVNSHDMTPGKIDAVQFDATVSSDEVLVTRIDSDLVLTISGTTDTLTLQNYLENEGVTPYSLEQILFYDGTSWDLDAVKSRLISNHAPELTVALPDHEASVGDVFTYAVDVDSFNDPDTVDTLTYSATLADGSALPAWLIFDASTRTFSGTPDLPGVLSVRVRATDLGNLTASDVFDITVNVPDLTVNGTSGADTLSGGAGNDILNGNTGDDVLSGNAGNDYLNGGGGNDTMVGGLGDDIYIVDSNGDAITESVNEGIDTVESRITHTLGANIESLLLAGALEIDGTGNALDNVLRGNASANILSGLDGNDTVYAGDRDNAYGGDGNDTLVSESTLINTNYLNWNFLWGEAGDDVLVGGVGSSGLIGGVGDDTITGGPGRAYIYGDDTVVGGLASYIPGGNDVISGGNDSDAVIAGGGDDLVYGNGGNDDLDGGQDNDTLYGGEGNDYLKGGQGIDLLVGGIGNDTYFVDAGDTIIENMGEGIDTVNSVGSYTLSSNVENLSFFGITSTNYGTGNAQDNVLTGSDGANVLDGRMGADIMTGKRGNDTYIIGRGYGADTVVENDSTAGNTDVAQFLSGVAADQIWFQHVGNNLEASIIGTSDKLVVKDWYLGTANRVEQFKTTDGAQTLLDSNVQNLVNAMASFAPPAAGQTSLPTDYQASLATVIAANWQ